MKSCNWSLFYNPHLSSFLGYGLNVWLFKRTTSFFIILFFISFKISSQTNNSKQSGNNLSDPGIELLMQVTPVTVSGQGFDVRNDCGRGIVYQQGYRNFLLPQAGRSFLLSMDLF